MKHRIGALASLAVILSLAAACGKDGKSSAERDAEIQKTIEITGVRSFRRSKSKRLSTFVLSAARVQIGPLVLFEDGRPFDELAPKAADYLTGKDIAIEVNLGTGGSHTATVWTCDLSAEYVKINAEYRT